MDGSKKLKKPHRTCINGMFPKGPPTHGAPLSKHGPPKDTTVPVFQWRASCCLSWEAMDGWQQTLPLVTHVSADGDGSISSSIQSVSSYSTLTQKTFDTNGTWSLDNFDRSSVWLCYLQQSNAWTTEKFVLAVGGYGPSHCSSPRLFPTQIPAWTTSNYYSFIWLFYLTVLHYSWNGTTFCLKTMLSLLSCIQETDVCILQSLWTKVILADLQLINIDISIDMWYKGFMDLPISQE